MCVVHIFIKTESFYYLPSFTFSNLNAFAFIYFHVDGKKDQPPPREVLTAQVLIFILLFS